MVSFQNHPLSPNQKRSIPDSENSSKKRKWDDPFPFVEEFLVKRSKPADQIRAKSLFDVELHLETPLPLEWQRCLDIQVCIYIYIHIYPLAFSLIFYFRL